MKNLPRVISIFALAVSSCANANVHTPFYIAVDGGLFQASYDVAYRDQTDLIPQNISVTSQQHGYSGGLALGFCRLIAKDYFLGAELSGHVTTSNARFESGASSTIFSDNTQINRYLDLTFLPGMMLSSSVDAYLKLGLSYASLQDSVTSPSGFTPTVSAYNSNQNALGFVGGLGLEKRIADNLSVFVEGVYHDYGVQTFSNFTNFSATYTHTARVYSYGSFIGMTYAI